MYYRILDFCGIAVIVVNLGTVQLAVISAALGIVKMATLVRYKSVVFPLLQTNTKTEQVTLLDVLSPAKSTFRVKRWSPSSHLSHLVVSSIPT